MRHRALTIVGLGVALTMALTGSAGALTLGITTPPSAFAVLACDGTVYEQYTSDPATPYTVPTGGGQITQWQTSTAADPANAAGASVTFVVLSSPGGTVVAADTETLPEPLPADGIASYTLAMPLTVAAGDVLAIYSPSLLHGCFFAGGTTPTADTLEALSDSSPPPIAGQELTLAAPQSPSGYALNLAATLSQPNPPPAQAQSAAATTSVESTGPNVMPTQQPAAKTCTVPRLLHTPSREAKAVLKALGCRVQVTHRRFKGVRQGRTIRTNPKHGTYAYHKVITLVISSGPLRPRP